MRQLAGGAARRNPALVGESGSGKSVTSLALMRLIEQSGGRPESGELWLRRRDNSVVDLARLRQSQMRAIRGADMAMIFQEPMTSLNPVFPVGEQIAESVRLHQGKATSRRWRRRGGCSIWCASPKRKTS